MIVAERKPIEEILGMVSKYEKIMLLGCGGCVSVCLSGGEKEVGILASQLRMRRESEGRPLDILEATIPRQCDWEYIDMIGDRLGDVQAILCIGCGAGVQAIVERFPEAIVYPGLNTSFLGIGVSPGLWQERCAGCGNCVLGKTGGICPVARCSKHIMNGPCGGSESGRCEVDPANLDCAWTLIHRRLQKLGRLDFMYDISDPKDWRESSDGGVRTMHKDDVTPLEIHTHDHK